AGTQRPRPGRDLANRDWPQDIDADPGESLPRVRLMPLDSTGREGGRRSAVLGVIGPRPDRRRRGDVAVGADLLVEGGFHEPDVTGEYRQRHSARQKQCCRGAAVPAGGAERALDFSTSGASASLGTLSCDGLPCRGSPGALAQWQSSGLLIRRFRVRAPDAPPPPQRAS